MSLLTSLPQDRRYQALESKRILVVEDDPIACSLLKRTLTDAGYEVVTVPDAPDALRHIQRNGLPHLVMLDLGLPTMHGFELSERIKQMGDVPIVIFTADDREESVVRGISMYAEDYIVKPLKPRELAARIRRVLSRISDFSYAAEPVITVDEHVAIDFPNNCLTVDGKIVPLTPIENRLLWTLVHNAGRVVRSDQLFSRVWPNEMVYEETLRVHMSRLRPKFAHSAQTGEYIHTERGLGYMFVFPVK